MVSTRPYLSNKGATMRKRSIFLTLAALVVSAMAIGPGNIGATETQLAEATFYVS